MYSPLLCKPRTCAKCPIRMDWVNTPASPAGWSQEIVCTQGDLNLRPNENASQTKTFTT
jgi:hypothetical protein